MLLLLCTAGLLDFTGAPYSHQVTQRHRVPESTSPRALVRLVPGSRCLCKCDCILASFHPSASRPITSCRILQPFTCLPCNVVRSILWTPANHIAGSRPYFCHTLRPDYHSRFSRPASCHPVILSSCPPLPSSSAPGFCSVSSVWRSRARLFPADITAAHRAAVCCLSHSHGRSSPVNFPLSFCFVFVFHYSRLAIAIRRQFPVPSQVIRFVLGPIRKRNWSPLPLPAASLPTSTQATAPPWERPRRYKRRPCRHWVCSSVLPLFGGAPVGFSSLPLFLSGYPPGFLSRRVLSQPQCPITTTRPIVYLLPLHFSLSLSLSPPFFLIHFLHNSSSYYSHLTDSNQSRSQSRSSQ